MTSRINNPDTDADVQLRECLDSNRSFIMIAGAGSGKTTSLVKALAYVSSIKGSLLRAAQQKIACITYTTVAEDEIKNDVNDEKLFHVSTIHGFLWEIIRPFQNDIKKWVISRIEEKISKIKDEQANYGPRVQQRTKDKHNAEIEKHTQTLQDINRVSSFRYETGSDYLSGILGHDDILKMVPQLIQSRPLLRTIIAKKFPYIFVDESQDTNKDVVAALISIDQAISNNFCLGFFGDPMQKIYTTGIGKIQTIAGWAEIKKPENFRCPTSILDIINLIRKDGDDLQQIGGKRIVGNDGKVEFVKGSAFLFLLNHSIDKTAALNQIRQFLSQQTKDDLWISDEIHADTKLLVIEHRMAAKRLGFEQLFSAFKDNSTETLAANFTEGKGWPLYPFIKFVLPLITSYKENNHFSVMETLRALSPLLQKDSLKVNNNKAQLLNDIKSNITTLINLFEDGSTTVKEILLFIEQHNLFLMDERLRAKVNPEVIVINDDEEQSSIVDGVIERYLNCPVREIWGYQKYINEQSPYSTQHSIKGAEFLRVLVVLDDEEGSGSTLYSYEKLFGLKALSQRDKENIEQGNDSVLDRTRRLLYVCCSRAVKDLAVAMFVADVEEAVETFKKAKIFDAGRVLKLEDLN